MQANEALGVTALSDGEMRAATGGESFWYRVGQAVGRATKTARQFTSGVAAGVAGRAC